MFFSFRFEKYNFLRKKNSKICWLNSAFPFPYLKCRSGSMDPNECGSDRIQIAAFLSSKLWSATLYRIQQQIVRGDASSSYAKYPGSPQYARASAQVSEILKEAAGSTYRKDSHQYRGYAPYQQRPRHNVPTKHYTSYPQKPAPHQQQAQAYYYEPTKARIKDDKSILLFFSLLLLEQIITK